MSEQRIVNVSYPFALFLKEFKEFTDGSNAGGLNGITWKLTSDGGGGIWVRGKSRLLRKGVAWLQTQEKSMINTMKSIEEPGMASYFRNKTGKDFLETTQTVTRCIILVDTDKCSEWRPAKTLATATIPSKNVSISVVQNDITAQQCDAIVNPSNSELELGSNGISKSILRKGGQLIRQEMKTEKKKIGTLRVGNAISTSAGNLPFKRIIHVNGLAWNKKSHEWVSHRLKECVEACLIQADLYILSSIALPVSICRNFDENRSLCISLIVQAILEYFDNNNSSIEQCYLVEMNNASVLKQMVKEVKKIGTPTTASTGLISLFKSMFQNSTSSRNNVATSAKAIVKLGDLSDDTKFRDAFPPSNSTTVNLSQISSPQQLRPLSDAANVRQGDIFRSNCECIVTSKDYDLRTRLFFFEQQHDSEEEIKLYMWSSKQANIDEAWERITQHVHDKSLRKILTNEFLDQLTANEMEELDGLEIKHNVRLKWSKNSRNLSELVISGLKDDVMEAYTAATEILQEYKEALTCAEYVVWKYKDPRSGKYVDFPLRASFQIHIAYKKNPHCSLNIEFRDQGNLQRYVIDFHAKTLKKVANQSATSVFRELKISTRYLPSTWKDMGKELWIKVELKIKSPEYKQVLRSFQATRLYSEVVKIERIQNPSLYKQFQDQKRKVKDRMKNSRSILPVTRNLFHGTSANVCENIYKDGFDSGYAGKNASAFGKGIYFATASQLSHGYAKRDEEGLYRMFYAEVITGEFCQGNSSHDTPPLMLGSSKQRYDSVVNKMNNPTMFVVFKGASVYPSYMLTYRP